MKKYNRFRSKQKSEHSDFFSIERFIKSNWVYLLISLISLVLFLFFLFSKPLGLTPQVSFEKDTLFNAKNTNSPYSLYVYFKNNFIIDKIIFDNIERDFFFEVDPNLYMQYDGSYYQLKDIINVIKQKRNESDNTSFLYFLEDNIGIKIGRFAYSNIDKNSNIFYVNEVSNVWGAQYSKIQKKQKIELLRSRSIVNNGSSILVYDIDDNDNLIQKNNDRLRNIKLEIYNSTRVNGYGTTISRLLKNMGYSVVKVQNYDQLYTNTTLYIQNITDESKAKILDLLNIQKVEKELPAQINSIADGVIILGGDTLKIY